MPRRPLGLRSVRESARRDVTIPRISLFAYLLSDGRCGLTGDRVARNRAEAKRCWPHFRKPAWAATFVGALPYAAMTYDHLTTCGRDVLWASWQDESFDLDAVLRGLDRDRNRVARFRARDPRGAKDITDYLRLFMLDLDRVEREARRVSVVVCEYPWQRGAPEIGSRCRYGDARLTRHHHEEDKYEP